MWMAVHGWALTDSEQLISGLESLGWQVQTLAEQKKGHPICELSTSWARLTLLEGDPECWLTGQVNDPNDNMYQLINAVRTRAEDWSFEVLNDEKEVLYRLSDTDFSQTDGIISL